MRKNSQKSILLVEDDPIFARTGAQTLERFGYDVAIAGTGEKGVELATGGGKVDLVLMDIGLGPGIDGTEAARQILARSPHSVPILFYTSYSDREFVDKVRDISRYGYVVKESGDFVLETSIEMALELHEKNRDLQSQIEALRQSETQRETILEDLFAHKAELQMQNDELRRIHLEEEISHARYFDLYDLAPIGYCSISEHGLVIESNIAFATLLGTTRAALAGQAITRFIYLEDRDIFYVVRNRLAKSGEPQDWELRMLRKDGTVFPAQLTAAVIHDDNGAPVYRVVINNITERKRMEEERENSLHEKEVLIREMHHRVKNNLQLISSLLNIQAAGVTDPHARAVLNDSHRRIHSMALVHESLYRSNNLANIPFGQFLEDLTTGITRSYGKPEVKIALDVAGINLEVESAIPCGLIINELVTNSLKHAFPRHRTGTISVSLHHASPSTMVLTVGDDGVGMPPDMDIFQLKSVGMSLVITLVEQISGTIVQKDGPGAKFSITFPS